MSRESLGLPDGTVLVVPYDPAWATLYRWEAARISAVLRARGVSLILEHTGSTSVVGLAAKPVLDLLAVRAPDADRNAIIRAIVAAGYDHRGEQGIVGRDFFRRGEPRQYHLHLAEIDSAFWHDHRDFRDYLRTHENAVTAYAALKYELSARFPERREAYIDGKTAFIQSTLRAARSMKQR